MKGAEVPRSWPVDQDDRLSGQALAAAREAQLLGGGRLHVHGIGREAEELRHALPQPLDAIDASGMRPLDYAGSLPVLQRCLALRPDLSPNIVLKDGDYVVFESVAVLYYLDLKYPEPPIFGRSPMRHRSTFTTCQPRSARSPMTRVRSMAESTPL